MSKEQTESNKGRVKRFADAANTHDPDLISKAVDEIFDPDVRAGTPMPIEATGPEGVKNVWATLHQAFPDLHISIEDLIAEQDKVVTRERITGTHRGNYMGLPATGKQVAYNEILIARFADGRIAEYWGVVDVLSLMKQLGAIPAAPGQPGIDA
jgi:steroid delta-isomerase-like uncharacterized protein